MGKGPEAGKGPEVGKAPEPGRAPEVGKAPEPSRAPEAARPASAQAGQPAAAKPGERDPGASKPSPAAQAGGRPTVSSTGGGRPSGTGTGGGFGGSDAGGRVPPPTPPAAAPAARGGGYGAGLVGGVIGGVIGAALAVFGAPFVQGPPPLAPQAESRLAAVESLADNLEPAVRTAVEAAVAEVPSRDGTAIAALAEEVASLAVGTAALDTRLTETGEQLTAARSEAVGALDQQLGAATERVAALESEVERQFDEVGAEVGEMIRATREAASAEVGAAQAALGDELESLRAEVGEATAGLAAVQDEVVALKQARSRAAAAALLVREIERSVDSGAPFAEQLGYLLPMAEGDATLKATLDDLQPYAEGGVPTILALREGLAALARTEAPAEIAGSEFLGQAVQNLYGLVQVRAKDDQSAVALGLLADADTALRAGDVATAIGHVEAAAAGPDGVDADRAAEWVAEAQARLAAVDARAQLDVYIRELLTATVN